MYACTHVNHMSPCPSVIAVTFSFNIQIFKDHLLVPGMAETVVSLLGSVRAPGANMLVAEKNLKQVARGARV